MTNLNQIPTMALDGSHPASQQERKNAVKSFRRSYLAVALYLAVTAVLVAGILILTDLIFKRHGLYYLTNNPYFIYAIQIFAAYIIGFPVFAAVLKGLPKSSAKKTRFGFGNMLAMLALSFAVMQIFGLVANIVEAQIRSLFNLPPTQSILPDVSAPFWLLTLVVAVLGPIFEELMFRKLMFDRLSVYGDRAAIYITALCFGLFHGNISQAIYATLLGIVLGQVYAKSRKIVLPCILHMLVNFSSVLGTQFLNYAGDAYNEMSDMLSSGNFDNVEKLEEILPKVAPLMLHGMAIMALAFAGIIVFIVLLATRRAKLSARCEIRLPRRTVIHSVLFNVGVLMLLLVLAYNFAVSLEILPTLADTYLKLVG